MALILHLETATRICSVSLAENDSLLNVIDLDEGSFAHGERLTLLIEEVLEKSGRSLRELNAISVSSGPGSYTGLRIGVSTAKGLCYALSIPLIAVNTLSGMVALAHEKHPGKRVCAMIDARRMEVYSLLVDSEGQVLKPVSADVLDETSYAEFDAFVCVGDGAAKCVELWNQRSLDFDLDFQPSAQAQVRLAYDKWVNGEFEDLAYFEPNYVKPFYQAPPKQK